MADELTGTAAAANGQFRLTRRQREVLGLLAVGMTDVEIAAHLSISPRTARMHCDALRVKLAVPRRRLIPAVYREMTGEDPYVWLSQDPLPTRGLGQ
jgi:DNA-binding CsgD family transcriptional regulator